MKRWEIRTQDNHILKLFYNTYEEAKANHFNCVIQESHDYEYLDYVQKIKEKATEILKDYKGRDVYKILIPDGEVLVRLYYEDIYLDGLEYQVLNNNRLINPITWTMSNPKEFYNKYLINKEIKYRIHSFRKYGEPKLSKPKELKGMDITFSVDYIPKHCKCQCFIVGNNLWIKHRDYFSESYRNPEDLGTPLEYRIAKYNIKSSKKSGFVYNDCWSDIVLRNEAWIVLENIIPQVQLQKEIELTRNVINKFCNCSSHRMLWTELDSTWNIFWENVVKELYKNNK